MKSKKTLTNFKTAFILSWLLIFQFTGKLFSQSASLPTDRARVTIQSITDAYNPSGPKLKVLRTDANTPLRAGTAWIWVKGTEPASYYASLKAYGLNSVRMILFDTWENEAYTPARTDWNDPIYRATRLATMETAVNYASAQGMYVIINSHNYIPNYNESYCSALWTYVAPYFANRTNVLYELSNEPMSGIGNCGAMDQARLEALKRTYNIARTGAPNTLMMILTPSGINDYACGTGLGNVADNFGALPGYVDWTKTAVAYHLYNVDAGYSPSINAANLRNLHSRYAGWPSENNFPVSVSNSTLGITDTWRSAQFDNDLYVNQTCERLGVGWSMWNINGQTQLDHNWPIMWADALAKGWTWTPDNVVAGIFSEAETNFTIMADVGTNGAIAASTYGGTTCSNGKYLSIVDPGDEANIAINVPIAGSYDVLVRVRSGWSGTPTYHIDNNFYQIKVNDILKTATLVSGSVTSTIDVDSYYGTLKCTPIALNAGVNYIRVKALGSWQKVDYVQAIAVPDMQAPTAPTGLNATGNTSSRLTLNWTASTDNVGVVTYEIFSNTISLGTSTTTAFGVIGLTPGTTYSFTVKAKDAANNISLASSVASNGNTLSYDVVVPYTNLPPVIDGIKEASWTGTVNTIGNLSVGAVTGGSDLSGNWTASWDNSNLYLFVNVTDDVIKVDGPNWYEDDRIELFIDADGNRGTTYTARDYQYYIRPGELSITETKQNATANVQVSNVSISGGYRLEVKIPFATLGITPSSLYMLGIDVQIADDDDGGNTDGKLAWYSINDNSWADPSLFGIAQLDAAAPTDTQAPTVPTGLHTSVVIATSFTLNWTGSTDNVAVTGYEVFKNGVSVGTTASNSMSITGLTSGTTYSMTVKACDAVPNWSAETLAFSVTTTDNVAPSIPVGLTVSGITTNGFTLAWTASSDNVGVTGYDIYKDGVFYNSVNATSASIAGLNPGVTYQMTVKAKDIAGNISAFSVAKGVQTSSNNILLNPGFENGTTSWTGQNGCTLTAITTFHSGSKGGSVSARVNQSAGPEQTITTAVANLGSGNYYLEAWVKMASGSSTVKASFKYRYNNTDYLLSMQRVVNKTWTKLSGTINVTYTGTLEFAQFYLETTSGTSSFFVDDCIVSIVGQLRAPKYKGEESVVNIQSEISDNLFVYPNPVSTELNVSNVDLDSRISIFNIDGRLVKDFTSEKTDLSINVSTWNKGIYFLSVQNEKQIKTTKFIVK